jgi:hypothetical protein
MFSPVTAVSTYECSRRYNPKEQNKKLSNIHLCLIIRLFVIYLAVLSAVQNTGIHRRMTGLIISNDFVKL